MSVALSLALLIFAFSYFNRLTSAATGTELYDELFPLNSTYSLGFTTASLNVSSNIETVDLSSTGLNIIGRSPAPVAYSGKQAFQAIYPKGAYAAVNIPEGLSFYVNGSDTFAAACAAGAKEVVVSYSVFFEKDFGFAAGGKIPGGCSFFSFAHSRDILMNGALESQSEVSEILLTHAREVEQLIATLASVSV